MSEILRTAIVAAAVIYRKYLRGFYSADINLFNIYKTLDILK